MIVKELIEILKNYPQDIEVAYSKYSEQCLLEAENIEIAMLCEARPDGWIQNYRPDKSLKQYLLFPGN